MSFLPVTVSTLETRQKQFDELELVSNSSSKTHFSTLKTLIFLHAEWQRDWRLRMLKS